jgi:hypothetical protein
MNSTQKSNKQKERQTGLIDDAAAMKVEAQAQAQKVRRGGGKKVFNFSKVQDADISKPNPNIASRNTGAPKAIFGPKNGRQSKSNAVLARPAADEAKFYEEDGLCIPLFDNKNKRKTHARGTNTLTQHLNKDKMLGIVRNYAGEIKVQEFEAAKASKIKIAEWIAAVETKAFGSGPKAKVFTSEKQTVALDAAPTKAQQKASAIAHNAHTEPDQNTLSHGANAQSKRKRDDDVTATRHQQTKKKTEINRLLLTARSG